MTHELSPFALAQPDDEVPATAEDEQHELGLQQQQCLHMKNNSNEAMHRAEPA